LLKKIFVFVLVCLLPLSSLPITDAEAAAALDTLSWYDAMGQAQSNDLQDVAVNKSKIYVAVGDEGTLLYSGDAREWKENHLAGTANLKAVATDGQQFVAVGEKGNLLTSPDGYSWTRSKLDKAFTIGQLTAVSDQKDYNTGYTIKWNTPFQPQWLAISSVIWDGKRFVAIGRWEVTTGARKTGSQQEHPSATVRGHVLLTSPNGSKWEMRSSTFAGRKLVFGGGKYIAISERTLSISSDLVKWTTYFPDVMKTRDAVQFMDMTYANGNFIAIGWDGNVSFQTGTLYTSRDGVNWKEIVDKGAKNLSVLTHQAIRSILWDGEQYWITGYKGTVLRSGNGTEWEKWGDRVTSQNPFYYEDWAGAEATVNKMIYDGSRYLMVGNRGTIIVSEHLTEAEVVRQRTPTDFTQILFDGGERYIARGQAGDIFESQDGYQWKKTTFNYPIADFFWSGFACGKGIALAVGYDLSVPKGKEDNVLLYSPSPGLWEKKILPVKLSSLFEISYTNGKFYLTGWEGYYTSADGITWSKLIKTTPLMRNIVSNGKVFLGRAMYSDAEVSSDQLFISSDGVKWKKIERQLNNKQYSFYSHNLQWTGKQFVATVGNPYSENGEAPAYAYSYASSTNGSTWAFKNMSQQIKDFAYNGKQFAGLADGGLYSSADGITYKATRASTGKEMEQIIWDGDKFIAVGAGGTILVSKKPPAGPLPWTELTEVYTLHDGVSDNG
jgi:hypothetical protein